MAVKKKNARARPLPLPVAGRSPPFPAAAADLVRPPRPRSAVAQDRRSVPHPRVRNHAAADAGRSRAAEVRRVARQVPLDGGAGRGAGAGRDQDLVSARLQHPAEAAAVDRARVGGEVRRPAAVGRGDAAVVQGDRRLHRRRDPQLRVPRARGDPRHQRGARALSRLRREGRSEEPCDETASLDDLGDGDAATARSSTSTRR